MEIKDFIEKFAEVLDDTDATTLSPETEFRELDEWSSLAALSIIAMVDEEFDVELSGNDVKNSQTIQDLYDKIKEKL